MFFMCVSAQYLNGCIVCVFQGKNIFTFYPLVFCTPQQNGITLFCFYPHLHTNQWSKMFLDVHPPITWQTAIIGDGLTGEMGRYQWCRNEHNGGGHRLRCGESINH